MLCNDEHVVHDSQIATRDWDDCKRASFIAVLHRSYSVARALKINNDRLIRPCHKKLRMSEQAASYIGVLIP